jgi:plastocyanin
MTSRLRLVALGAAILLGSSCAGSSTPRPRSTPFTTASSPTVSIEPPTPKGVAPKPLVVHIRGFAYVPAAPVVIVGQPIEIINDDAAAHTWSAARGSGWVYTSGNLDKGQRVTFPGFTHPGSYRFLCYYHAEMPSMNGVVTVKAAP